MKRLTCLFVLFLLVGMAPVAWAGPREEVRQVIRQFIQAFREGNAEAIKALYADDGIHFHADIPFRFEGNETIRRHFAETFEKFPKRPASASHISLNIYGDSTAVWARYVVITFVDREGRAKTQFLRITDTLVKQGDKWLIVSHHASLLPTSHR